jgi:CheY-like chemotaxis protein
VANPAGPLVLIIDDEPDTCGTFEQYLTSQGFSVICAFDGAEGLVKAKAERPNAIVLDLGLPEVDGWEVARRLRQDPATAAIPIVAVTAYAAGDARDRALEAGVDSVLVKPCPPHALLAEIQSLRER